MRVFAAHFLSIRRRVFLAGRSILHWMYLWGSRVFISGRAHLHFDARLARRAALLCWRWNVLKIGRDEARVKTTRDVSTNKTVARPNVTTHQCRPFFLYREKKQEKLTKTPERFHSDARPTIKAVGGPNELRSFLKCQCSIRCHLSSWPCSRRALVLSVLFIRIFFYGWYFFDATLSGTELLRS